MDQQEQRPRLWAWYLSALFYEWSYIQVAHQTDIDFFRYLGDRIVGATVVDCGCGPGVVTEKFLEVGAARVVAIDANIRMIEKAQARLAKAIASGQVLLQHASHEGETLPALQHIVLGDRGFDIVLFKRSLYMPRPRALLTLRRAASTLCTDGVMVVVHPERSLWRYAFAPPFGITAYTFFHVFNRVISRLAECCGMEEYTLYSRRELFSLLHEAVPEAQVEIIPSQQRPYNLMALQAP
jgi:SAM-dependent methyltransferase